MLNEKPLERVKVEWVLNKREKMMWSVGNWKSECWMVWTIEDGLILREIETTSLFSSLVSPRSRLLFTLSPDPSSSQMLLCWKIVQNCLVVQNSVFFIFFALWFLLQSCLQSHFSCLDPPPPQLKALRVGEEAAPFLIFVLALDPTLCLFSGSRQFF